MRRLLLVFCLAGSAACHRTPPVEAGPRSMATVYAELDAKCTEDPSTLTALIARGAHRVEETQPLGMTPEIFAVVLNDQLGTDASQQACAPIIEALPYTITSSGIGAQR